MKSELSISDFQALQTDRNRIKGFTGSLFRIISSSSTGSLLMIISWRSDMKCMVDHICVLFQHFGSKTMPYSW
ncbi:hypothetical protein Hanom_Chr16g01516891 [Helianthus anomalus]